MANLVAVSSFDDVYQIETTDVVLGGPGEVANSQAQALTNRTAYLKERVDRSQKVYFSDFSSVSLTYSGNSAVKVFTFTPGSALDNRPLISKLRFKVAIFDNYVSTSKVFDFELILNESHSPSIKPKSRLILQKYYGLSEFDQSFYFIMKKVIPATGHAYYEFYIEKNTSNNHHYHFIQTACLDEMDSYKGFYGTGSSESIINHVVFETGTLTAIPSLKNVSSDDNYITSILFIPVIHTDPYATIVSQPMDSYKTPASWNNDYIIGGNSQKILYSGPKTVALTTTNTAVKLFSYKYKLTATPLSDQRLDKSVKFDVHYGCISDVFQSMMRQFEFSFLGESFFLKLLKQSSDIFEETSVVDNSPLDIYLIARQRDDVDGYTYFDFYLDDARITETRTKNIELVIYDDVKESLRDKIIFESSLSAIGKMYSVSSSANIQTSIHCNFAGDDALTNQIVSGQGIINQTPSSATPISIIGETRIKTAETDIDNLQNLVFSQWEYVVPGSYTWTCPQGVTKIKLFVVGGGASGNQGCGGGGGGVSIHNNLTVVPGTSYNLAVGSGGQAGSTSQAGSQSHFNSSVIANGGSVSANSTSDALGGTASGGEINLTGGIGSKYDAVSPGDGSSSGTGGGGGSVNTSGNSAGNGGDGTYGGGGGGGHSLKADGFGGSGGSVDRYGGNGGAGNGKNSKATPGQSSKFGGGPGRSSYGGGGGFPGGGGGGGLFVSDPNNLGGGGGGNGCVIIRVGGSNF